MGVKLVSASGGSVEINPPATASNFVATMPAGTGNVVVNGINGAIVSGTSVSASSTSVDFTGIPSWVKRITVMFNGVSTNGTSIPLIQIGSGSIVTSSYFSNAGYAANGAASSVATFTSGFGTTGSSAAAATYFGTATITALGGNVWIFSWSGTQGSNTFCGGGGASSALSGTLDRVRITTVNGTDTFDAGTINILYE